MIKRHKYFPEIGKVLPDIPREEMDQICDSTEWSVSIANESKLTADQVISIRNSYCNKSHHIKMRFS